MASSQLRNALEFKKMVKKLSELLPGTGGIIRNIIGNTRIAQRLMSLAFLPGQSVEVSRLAPLGDPIMIKLGDSVLSLRKREASYVLVECANETDQADS